MRQRENKIKIKGINLFPKQLEITNKIISSSSRYITLNASRQFSKSTIMEQAILYYSLNSKCKCLYITPTYSLAKVIMSRIYENLVNSNVIRSFNKSDNLMTFINGSEIYFRSATNPDTIRGLSINYVFIDEAAFISDEAWSVIRPTLAVIGKKCIMASTPRGKNGFFYQHVLLGQTGDPNYLYLYGHYKDNPFYNRDDVENARQVLPKNVFEQEYNAEFLDDGGSVFQGINDVMVLNRFKGFQNESPYYIGIDLGRQGDFTVVIVLNKRKEVVDVLRINKTDWNIIVNDIIKIVKKYPGALVYSETNGVGDVVFDLLRKSIPSIKPFITTNDTKNEIIEELILAIQTRSIILPTKELFPEMSSEFETYSFTYSTKTRRIIYGAKQGFHDDIVMSLAISNYASKKPVGIKYSIAR